MKKNNYFVLSAFLLFVLNSCCFLFTEVFEVKNDNNYNIYFWYPYDKDANLVEKGKTFKFIRPGTSTSSGRDVTVAKYEDMRQHWVVNGKLWVEKKQNYFAINIPDVEKITPRIKVNLFGYNGYNYDIFKSVEINTIYELPDWSSRQKNKFFLFWAKNNMTMSDFYYHREKIQVGEKNIDLYSVWADKGHTVTFDPNFDPIVDVDTYFQNVEENKNFTLRPNEFIYAGYKFLGWAKDKSSVTAIYSDKENILMGTEDIVLYAIWQKL